MIAREWTALLIGSWIRRTEQGLPRHGIWLSDASQPQLDLADCPEIITAQHRANRLLRRCTPRN